MESVHPSSLNPPAFLTKFSMVLTPIVQTTDVLFIKQINLHHAKCATALIDGYFSKMHTEKHKKETIVLIQEPWIVKNKIQGLDTNRYNIPALPGNEKLRTCIITSKSLNITPLPQFCDGDITSLLMHKTIGHFENGIIFCSGYLPHDDDGLLPSPKLRATIDFAHKHKYPIIIGCDANAHHFLWGSSDVNSRGESLAEYIASTNLEILNKGNTPTFITSNRSEVLDITLASNEIAYMVTNWRVSEEETLSDHREINFSLGVKESNAQIYRNPRTTDWHKFAQDVQLGIDVTVWPNDISDCNMLDTVVNDLTSIISEAFTRNCKAKSGGQKNKPWWNQKLGSLRKKCRQLYRKYKVAPEPLKSALWEAYKAIRNEYQREIKNATTSAWRDFCENIEGASATSRIHKVLAKDIQCKPGFLRDQVGSLTETLSESARLLMDIHFPGNRNVDNSVNHDNGNDYRPLTDELINSIVNTDRVTWAINSFSPFKSPGLDGIYPKLLQTVERLINDKICSIYKAALLLGYTPRSWQKVKVTFIPKPGKDDYTNPKSFRPISLTSFLLKGLERLIDKSIREHLSLNGHSFGGQHAFQEGKSTETALHELVSLAEMTYSNNEYAVATFMDIEGAFDNVSFDAIERAFNRLGINQLLGRWIKNYLSSRMILYESNGTLITVTATKGTPQGGVISPFLWILVMDELLVELKTAGHTAIGYADDVVVICRGKFLDTVCNRTQDALGIVESWCNRAKLSVNPSKTELMVFTKKRNLTDFQKPKIFGHGLEMKNKVKYLGLTLTPKLNWNDHILYRITKCVRVFWTCRRAIGKIWGLRPTNILWIFTAIARPMLTYGALLWWKGVTTQKAERKINQIQRLACLAITGAYSTTSQSALEAILNLPSIKNYIIGEARLSALRLKNMIKHTNGTLNGHLQILDDVHKENPILMATNDQMTAKYSFNKRFDTLISTSEDWINPNFRQIHTGDYWFTDACVKPQGGGYGVVDDANHRNFHGPLGNDLTPKHAEIAAIHICCSIIASEGTNGQDLYICTESQQAIHALVEYKTKSKLIYECISLLNDLSINRNVTLIQTPKCSDIPGSVTASEMATVGAKQLPTGPLPLLPITEHYRKKMHKSWILDNTIQAWRNSSSGAHTKLFIHKPNDKIALKFLNLRKADLRLVVGLITDNIGLNAYKSRVRLRADPECDRCSYGTETGKHFLRDCPAWSSIRHTLYGVRHLPPSDVIKFDLMNIIAFATQTGRLESHGRPTNFATIAPPTTMETAILNITETEVDGGQQNR